VHFLLPAAMQELFGLGGQFTYLQQVSAMVELICLCLKLVGVGFQTGPDSQAA